MIERVRAVLVTPDGCLLAIRRDRPGRVTYCVLPGGHVDPGGRSLEAALSREISEEIAEKLDGERFAAEEAARAQEVAEVISAGAGS